MPFESVLITGGVVGASLLLGAMAQTLWISNEVRAVASWFGLMLFVCVVGGVLTSYHPVVEPLWLHDGFVIVLPFAVGFVGLALWASRGSDGGGEFR